jgi:hypothetical protein
MDHKIEDKNIFCETYHFGLQHVPQIWSKFYRSCFNSDEAIFCSRSHKGFFQNKNGK